MKYPNFSAFTISHYPALPWLYENLKRNYHMYTKWYVIVSYMEDQLIALREFEGKDLAFVHESYSDPYRNILDRIRDIPNVELIVRESSTNKLDACNECYHMCDKDTSGCSYLIMHDSDEWFAPDDIELIQYEVTLVRPDIINLTENKYWKNYYILDKGIWKGYPARVFRIYTGCKFGGHRPPSLAVPDGKIFATCDPRKPYVPRTRMLAERMRQGPLMDHFTCVDPIIMKQKSQFFSVLRKDMAGYRDYWTWFNEYYLPWTNRDFNTPYKYHPAAGPNLLNQDSLGIMNLCDLQKKYPESAEFLEMFYNKGE